MRAYDLIRKKRDGGVLQPAELEFLVQGATDGSVADEQLAAFLMAVFFRGLDPVLELPAWLEAMLRSGQVLDLSRIPGRKVDKHSTGGVGDKISLPLAPLAAVCGVRVPMVSGRGLGHTGGTLDKLESSPGFRVDLPIERFVQLVESLGLCLIGQTAEIAPADRKLYALRDATATVESVPLIASSILSKKLAEGIDALVLDVKVGSGAFMKSLPDARLLARTLIDLCRGMGRRCTALLTAMDAPLGFAVGNAVEVAESIEVLRGGGPDDVRELTLQLGVEMLLLGEAAPDVPTARQRLEDALADGSALRRSARCAWIAAESSPRSTPSRSAWRRWSWGRGARARRTAWIRRPASCCASAGVTRCGRARCWPSCMPRTRRGSTLAKRGCARRSSSRTSRPSRSR